MELVVASIGQPACKIYYSYLNINRNPSRDVAV